MSALPKHRYTLEEYYRIDADSEEKLEYWDGNVWTVSGASPSHNRIVRNFIRRLDERLESRGCEVFPSDQRINVPAYPPYRYPDMSALCGKANFISIGGLDALTNPQLIIEVLSDSTAAFDRGDKFTYYNQSKVSANICSSRSIACTFRSLSKRATVLGGTPNTTIWTKRFR